MNLNRYTITIETEYLIDENCHAYVASFHPPEPGAGYPGKQVAWKGDVGAAGLNIPEIQGFFRMLDRALLRELGDEFDVNNPSKDHR